MKKLALVLCLLFAACTHTQTVVERVEVPVPYWAPPTDIKELPARKPLETQRITPVEGANDPTAAMRAVAEDIRALIEENELIRHYYEELVKLIEAKPEEEEP